MDQMQFNLHTPSNLMNMATRFKLRPTPIVLQRVSPVNSPMATVAQPQCGLMPFEQRMELASRLAKREIEKKSPAITLSQDLTNKPCSISGKGAGRWVEPSNYEPVVEKDGKETLKKTNKKLQVPSKQNVKINETRNQQTHKRNDQKWVCPKGAESKIDSTAHEILKLRKELVRKMQRLKVLSLKADLGPSPPLSPLISKPRPQDSRFGWIEDKTRDRHKRKVKGQAVRNARLLYQLQQKVKEARRDVEGSSNSAHSRLLAMHKLASAHREAVRTIHHLTLVGVAKGDHHDNEVTDLVDQLSNLCIQAKVGGVDREELKENFMGSLVKELHEYHCHVKQLLRTEREGEERGRSPGVSSNTKRHRKRVQGQKGALLKPRYKGPTLVRERGRALAGPCGVWPGPHGFTRQTFASIQKRSPKKKTRGVSLPHPQSPDSPPISRGPVSHPPYSYHSLSQEPSQYQEPHPPRSQEPHLPPQSQEPHPPQSQEPHPPHPSPYMGPPVDDTNMEHTVGVKMPWEQDGQSMIEREIARQLWLDRRALELSRDMERNMLREKERANHNRPVIQTGSRPKDTEMGVHGNISMDPHSRVILRNDIETTPTHRVNTDINEEAELMVQRQGLLNMAERIKEMERERNIVQARWDSVHYKTAGPGTLNITRSSGPSSDFAINITRPSGPGSDSAINITRPSMIRGHNADSVGTHGIKLATGSSVSTYTPGPSRHGNISEQSLSNIIDYRDQYSHHLRMCAIRNRGFDPSKHLESVCDELFDELLEDMAREMLSGLEQCVNQLFDTEFHNPT